MTLREARVQVREIMQARGYDPIEDLIDIAQTTKDVAKRQEIAELLMPFVHRRQPAPSMEEAMLEGQVANQDEKRICELVLK